MQKTPALPRYLRVAIALSSALSSATLVGCGAGNAAPSSTPTTSAADAGSPKPGPLVSSSNDDGPVSKVDDYTGGEGPCRCSWDTNVSGAARVCKKNETAYNGTYCMPRKRSKYGKYPPVIGPLAPPDLPRRVASRARTIKRNKPGARARRS
jgi:hypothetical protein